MAQLLAETELTDKQNHYVSVLNQSGRLLMTVLNDILDYSKIEAGKTVFEHKSFDIHSTVKSIFRMMTPLAEEKGLKVL